MKVGDMSEQDKMERARDMDHHCLHYRDGVVHDLRVERMCNVQAGAEDGYNLARWKVSFNC